MAVALAQNRAERVNGLIDRVDPGVLANERLLPVIEPLASLLPQAGLRRGSSLATGGCAAVSLALAVCGAASQAGSWVALVGLDDIGWAAAREQDVVLERCFSVARPPADRWAEIVAVAAEGADLVVTRRPPRLAPGQIRRLQSRLATRGAVLLIADGAWHPSVMHRATVQPLRDRDRRREADVVEPAAARRTGRALGEEGWRQNYLPVAAEGSEQTPGGDWSADVWMSSRVRSWEGIGAGHGRLVARRVAIEVGGRRAAGRSSSIDLLLPGPSGRLAAVDDRPGSRNGGADAPIAEVPGSLTSVGSLTPAGALASAGALVPAGSQALAGALTPAGSLTRAGSLAPAGALPSVSVLASAG